MNAILSINGSDNSGWTGLQLDLKIIAEMGGHPLTSATCIVLQNDKQIQEIVNFPTDIIRRQVAGMVSDYHPKAIKIGLLRSPEAAKVIAEEIRGCRNIIVAPGFFSTSGEQLIDDETIDAIKRYLIPQAKLLMLRQKEAEKILGCVISNDQEMVNAAQQVEQLGAEYVMIRGGRTTADRLTALLYSKHHQQFFSSYNIEGWQQHGVGGALSAAIVTQMGMGEEVPEAIRNAHQFVHSRIVYSVSSSQRRQRPADIYNEFMSLISDNYRTAHDVQFYADKLNISPRYLSQITNGNIQKSPKQVIAGYLLHESRLMLENSRLSIKEIADVLGFTSTALFCKFFKQQQGLTPSDYRCRSNGNHHSQDNSINNNL